jgi:AcrR family transcriptional regulator
VSARDDLLDRCQVWLEANGFGAHSLRQIAAGVGTSHRMLIYHFGSREGLLAEIVGRIEADTRGVLTASAGTADSATVAGDFWRYLAQPELADAERLFYEIYAEALHDRPWSASFRAAVIDALDGPVTGLFEALGWPPEEARVRSRLAIAVTRGLLLDLLLTGDRELLTRASDLFAELVTRPDQR